MSTQGAYFDKVFYRAKIPSHNVTFHNPLPVQPYHHDNLSQEKQQGYHQENGKETTSNVTLALTGEMTDFRDLI